MSRYKRYSNQREVASNAKRLKSDKWKKDQEREIFRTYEHGLKYWEDWYLTEMKKLSNSSSGVKFHSPGISQFATENGRSACSSISLVAIYYALQSYETTEKMLDLNWSKIVSHGAKI